MSNSNEDNLFPELNESFDWKKEWQGMPEFIQEDLRPIQRIVVNFESFDDVQKFAELVNQKLTNKTDSIWFPKKELEQPKNFRYFDEQ